MTNVLDVLSDLQLLEFSKNARIERSITEWPAMQEFLKFWRRFETQKGSEFNDNELRLRRSILRFISRCNGIPLSPSRHEDIVEELRSSISKSAETSSQNRSEILQLGHLLESLLRTDNPASRFLEDWISSREVVECPEGHVRHGEPSVTLVLRDEDERELAAYWLNEQELYASTATYRELRNSYAYEYLVFFGSPDRYVSSAWLRSPGSWYQTQWLVTTPAASISLFLNWTGHRTWQVDLLGPWANSRAPIIQDVSPEAPAGEDVFLEIEDLFLPNASEEPEIPGQKHELINALGFQVVSEGGLDWVYFCEEVPPRPRMISPNREQIEFLKPGQLRPGVLLVVNDESEREAILDDYTHRYWTSHYGTSSIERAEAIKRDLKRKVREALDRLGKDELVHRMVLSGLEAEYARTVLGSIPAEDYIAPRRRDALDHLQSAGEFKLAHDSNELLRHLRVARQQAGAEINELLRKKLISSEGDDAMDAAESRGWCDLITPDLGRIGVHRVAAASLTNRLVPRSWLGRLRGHG